MEGEVGADGRWQITEECVHWRNCKEKAKQKTEKEMDRQFLAIQIQTMYFLNHVQVLWLDSYWLNLFYELIHDNNSALYTPYSGKIWQGLKFGNLASSWKLAQFYSLPINTHRLYTIPGYSASFAIICMTLRKYL